MRSINIWVRRFREAHEEIQRVTAEAERWKTAFTTVLPLLTDEQLTHVAHLMDVEEPTYPQ